MKLSGAFALAAFTRTAWLARFGIAGEAFFFWVSALIVGGSLMLGLLLLGSEKFRALLFSSRRAFRAGQNRRRSLRSSTHRGSEMHAYFWASKARLAKVTLTSVFIWFLHLLQIWMFILALRAYAPFLANSCPLSTWRFSQVCFHSPSPGVGTRDAALVIFYAPFFPAPTAAALGLLCKPHAMSCRPSAVCPSPALYLTAAKARKAVDAAS
jgi:hypothetical protein